MVLSSDIIKTRVRKRPRFIRSFRNGIVGLLYGGPFTWLTSSQASALAKDAVNPQEAEKNQAK